MTEDNYYDYYNYNYYNNNAVTITMDHCHDTTKSKSYKCSLSGCGTASTNQGNTVVACSGCGIKLSSVTTTRCNTCLRAEEDAKRRASQASVITRQPTSSSTTRSNSDASLIKF